MEKKNITMLHSILRFSVLCNILPYYGFIHEWKILLELINKKGCQIWSKNREAFINLGRKFRHKKVYKNKNNYEIIPKNSELFYLKTNLFVDSSMFKLGSSWIFTNLLGKLLNQLKSKNAIIMWNNNEPGYESISFLTEKEIEELTPSALWTSSASNIKKFLFQERNKLWRYIREKIKSKVIIIRKGTEVNNIEVNTVVPFTNWDSQEYNILNHESFEVLKKIYSWPVENCIWKPKKLWFLPNYVSLNIEDLLICLTNEVTERISNILILDNLIEFANRGVIARLLGIQNLFKIAKKFSKTKISSSIWYIFDKKFEGKTLRLDSKQISIVFKGKEWGLEILGKFPWAWNIWNFLDFKPVEDKDLVIIKVGSFTWLNASPNINHRSDNKKLPYIEELIMKTKNNEEMYIVADTNKLNILSNIDIIEKNISAFKYCNQINIDMQNSTHSLNENLDKINNLPKQYNYMIEISNIKEFSDANGFDMIDCNFENLVINTESYFIRIISHNHSLEVKKAKRMFGVRKNMTQNEKIVDATQLKKILAL